MKNKKDSQDPSNSSNLDRFPNKTAWNSAAEERLRRNRLEPARSLTWCFPMKTIARILLLFCLFLHGWEPVDSDAQVTGDRPSVEKSLTLKWLGTAGWEIQFGQTVILIDPFLTRGVANPGAEWKTDEQAVLNVIKRADYIFAGHSHADHIADVPFIAKKFGSKVIGSRTTTNIALTGGVDKSQLVTISGGENLDFKEFSVQVIESEHGDLTRARTQTPAEI